MALWDQLLSERTLTKLHRSTLGFNAQTHQADTAGGRGLVLLQDYIVTVSKQGYSTWWMQ